MCGIVATVGPSGTASAETLTRGMAALHHRGPDSRNVWVDASRSAALGHVRLSIMDLAGGSQPISSEDGAIQIAVNGEFYGFEKIREELGARGHVFKTRSDSEILIHLYEEYGTECLKHLRGEFAFVLWDERNQALFAARDRFGIKPLYYAQDSGRLLIASEAKALFRMGLPARWDAEAFYLNNYFVMPENRTLFHGVMQIPPAHRLTMQNGALRVERYWDLDFPRNERGFGALSDAECEEVLLSGLNEAIRVRLRSDVPVGCYLSGGLDSSAILALASAQASAPLKAFTISFDHESYDEAPLAAEAAKKAGADLQCVRVRMDDLWDQFPNAIYHAEGIALNTNGVAKFILSQTVRNSGCRVVLTGEGADEVLGGYPHFVRDSVMFGSSSKDKDIARTLAALQNQNAVFQGLEASKNRAPWLERVLNMLGFIPSLWSCFYPIGQARRMLFTDGFQLGPFSQNPYEQFLASIDRQGQLGGRPVVNQSQYLWTKTWLPEYILKYLGDRMEMAHSIEGRVPFLDHRLFETLRRMPVGQKIRGTSEKNVLKRAMRNFVPESIVKRPKHPFAAPPAQLSPKQKMTTLLRDLLGSASAAAMPFYDRRKILKLLDGLPQWMDRQDKNLDAVLVSVASTYVLHDRFALSG